MCGSYNFCFVAEPCSCGSCVLSVVPMLVHQSENILRLCTLAMLDEWQWRVPLRCTMSRAIVWDELGVDLACRVSLHVFVIDGIQSSDV